VFINQLRNGFIISALQILFVHIITIMLNRTAIDLLTIALMSIGPLAFLLSHPPARTVHLNAAGVNCGCGACAGANRDLILNFAACSCRCACCIVRAWKCGPGGACTGSRPGARGYLLQTI
jgi:hypothetical protein